MKYIKNKKGRKILSNKLIKNRSKVKKSSSTNNKNRSLRNELIKIFIMLTTIPILIMTIFITIAVKNTLKNKIEESTSIAAYQMKLNAQNVMNNIIDTTLITVLDDKVRFFIPDRKLSEYEDLESRTKISNIKSLLKYTQVSKYFSDLFVIYSNGEYIGEFENAIIENKNKEEFYTEMKALVGTDAYKCIYNYEGDKYNIYCIRKANDGAILVGTYKVNSFNKIFKDEDKNSNSLIKLLDKENNIMYSNNGNLIGTKEEEGLINKISEGNSIFNYNDNMNFSENFSSDFILLVSITEKYMFKEIKILTMAIIMMAIIFILVSSLLGKIVADKFIKPILDVVSLMKKAENGDLTVEGKYTKNDELGVLTNSFNGMINNIKNLVNEAVHLSNEVENQVNNIQTISKNTRVTSEQVAKSIEEISCGAIDQAKQSEQTLNMMTNLAENINVVTERISNVSMLSNNTKDIGNKSLIKVKELEDITKKSNENFENVTSNVNVLIESIKDIEIFLETIRNISIQTNLLALNASIEAAHAGEYGRGFAVVSSEVRNLSEQSKASADQISGVIKNIQKHTKEVGNIMELSTKVFNIQKEAVEYTSSSFNGILLVTDSISSEINNVEQLVSNMNESKEASIKAVAAISSVAEESSSTTEEVTEITEHQVISANELNELTEKLYGEVEKLKNSISKFKS